MSTTSPSFESSYSSWKCFFFERWQAAGGNPESPCQSPDFTKSTSQFNPQSLSREGEGECWLWCGLGVQMQSTSREGVLPVGPLPQYTPIYPNVPQCTPRTSNSKASKQRRQVYSTIKLCIIVHRYQNMCKRTDCPPPKVPMFGRALRVRAPCTTNHTWHWRGSTQSMPRGSSFAGTLCGKDTDHKMPRRNSSHVCCTLTQHRP